MSDDLASAFMASLVAGNLQHVDENTVQMSALGPAKKINPKSFLPSAMVEQEVNQQNEKRKRIADELNREAMRTHPHSDSTVLNENPRSMKISTITSSVENEDLASMLKIFKSIDTSLKKLVKHLTTSES